MNYYTVCNQTNTHFTLLTYTSNPPLCRRVRCHHAQVLRSLVWTLQAHEEALHVREIHNYLLTLTLGMRPTAWIRTSCLQRWMLLCNWRWVLASVCKDTLPCFLLDTRTNNLYKYKGKLWVVDVFIRTYDNVQLSFVLYTSNCI